LLIWIAYTLNFIINNKKKTIGRSAYKKINNNNIAIELIQLFVFSSHWVRKKKRFFLKLNLHEIWKYEWLVTCIKSNFFVGDISICWWKIWGFDNLVKPMQKLEYNKWFILKTVWHEAFQCKGFKRGYTFHKIWSTVLGKITDYYNWTLHTSHKKYSVKYVTGVR
jgi:hypothetical protein